MLRTIWVAIVALGVTIFFAPGVIIVGLFNSTSPIIDRCIRLWGRSIARAAGLRIRRENFELIDPNRKYIFIANHHSYLDIPSLLATVPQPLRFVAKKSLFQIPIFGWGLTIAGFIPIDRKNRRSAVKSFDLAADRIRRGNSIVIFPEEGRSREKTMRPFQRGAFLLAMRSELPIVPIAIIGTYEVMPATRLAIRPGVVTIRASAPIDTSTLSVRAKDELMTRTRETIEAMMVSGG